MVLRDRANRIVRAGFFAAADETTEEETQFHPLVPDLLHQRRLTNDDFHLDPQVFPSKKRCREEL